MLTGFYSDELLDLLFDKSEDFIGIYDLTKSQFVRINQAGVRLLGYASEEALLTDPIRSRSLRSTPLVDESHTSLIEKLLQSGHHVETTRIGRSDGQTFWGKLSINTFSAQENPYALVRLNDQGRLYQAEHDRDYSIQRYEAIFSHATIGIIVCDQQGQIVSANHLAGTLFGYLPREMEALTIEQLVPAGLRSYHEIARQRYNKNPQARAMAQNQDLYAQRKDSSVFSIEVSLSYFRLEGSLYVVAYVIDSSVKKAAELQLKTHHKHIQQLNAELEQKVADRTDSLQKTLNELKESKDELAKSLTVERDLGELKSRFVAMASHEFRTPLTTILNATNLIEKYPAADQQGKREKHLDRIRSSVRHLNDILEEFLSLGKLEDGKVEAHPTLVDMALLVEDTVADLQTLLKHNQSIKIQLSCLAPVWLDPSLLRKILLNLLTNAVKYSGTDSEVTLQASCFMGQLTLVIEDQGIGISQADQIHLFGRFFRAKNVTNITGSGLGLYIVGRYVALMGGQITLQSELNKGTIITLTLPYENHPAH